MALAQRRDIDAMLLVAVRSPQLGHQHWVRRTHTAPIHGLRLLGDLAHGELPCWTPQCCWWPCGRRSSATNTGSDGRTRRRSTSAQPAAMLTAASLVVLGGAFAGGFVSGLAGFGTGLMALGIWLYVLEPATAATLVALCSVVSPIQTIRVVWHAIEPARVWPMLAAGLVGAQLVTHLDRDAFRLCIGILLLAFSAFMLLGRFHPRVAWGGRTADGAIGFAGGILGGGLAGLSGALPTVWATLRGWGKDERRGVFQAFNLTIRPR